MLKKPHVHGNGCHQSEITLLVVNFVGWTIILCIGGTLLVKWTGIEPPEWFKDIALVALGALAGVLTTRGLSEQVTVNNPPENPVPTTTEDKPEGE